MANTLRQLEKNVSASFGYVKKDLMMLNDALDTLREQIQHLSLNHAALLGEIERLRKGDKKVDKKNGGKKKVVRRGK